MATKVIFRNIGGWLCCFPRRSLGDDEHMVIVPDKKFEPVASEIYLCELRRSKGGSKLILGGTEYVIYLATPVPPP